MLETWVLDLNTRIWTRLVFAFIPITYSEAAIQLPVQFAYVWTPLTHAFLHADWMHLFVNSFWMVAFGSPVAKRFGVLRFCILFIACAFGGAFMHYAFHSMDNIPLIGASGAVSGFMGAAARFAFINPGAFNAYGPALSLIESFKNKQFLVFIGIWMVLNFVFGTTSLHGAGENVSIAWQAHIGGFIVGILAFSLLDPIKHRKSDQN